MKRVLMNNLNDQLLTTVCFIIAYIYFNILVKVYMTN